MPKVLKLVLGISALLVALALSFYFYYLYVPSPDMPLLQGSYQHYRLEVDGLERTYGVYVPKIVKDKPALVFVLHGSASSGDKIRESTGMAFDTLAEERDFILVYPDGYQHYWNDCRGSADYAANTENIDDVGFFRQMISHLASLYDINTESVFVTGHSNGGQMVYKLALESPDLFAAFAPVSANLPVMENLDCNPSGKAVSMAIFNGTDDPINPYNGGLVSILGNDSRGQVCSSDDTIAYWAGLARAKPLQPIEHPEYDGDKHTRIIETRWSGINGEDIRLYSMIGSGHVIPSKTLKMPRALGRAAGDMDGPGEIVAFFLK